MDWACSETCIVVGPPTDCSAVVSVVSSVFELRRRLCICITEVKGISIYAVCVIILEGNEKKSTHKSSIALTALRKATLVSDVSMTIPIAKPGVEGKSTMRVSNDNRLIAHHLRIVM